MTQLRLPALTFAAGLLAGATLTARAGTPTPSAPPPHAPAPRVTGLGGVFFTAEDPEALRAWYARHLGLEIQGAAGATFLWREAEPPHRRARTAWSVFPAGTEYFGSPDQRFMLNYRVPDLEGLLARLAAEGVHPVKEPESYPYGDFAWIEDGEGNRIELWEAPDEPEG